MLPATVMFVYIGSLSSDIARIGSDENSTNTIKWAIRIIGFIATVAITIYATQIAKKAIAEIDN
jgi:uncharacterized membrane protein YdjX (TVP38/TMEM64 family)